MKTKKMPKNRSVAKVKKRVWLVFSRYIRLRDCLRTTGSPEHGECISCGEPKSYSELDAGHFVAKHANNYFSERGVNIQCQSCNRFKGGNPLGYRRGLLLLYGEEITSELELENRPIKKFTVKELEELEVFLLEKLSILEGK